MSADYGEDQATALLRARAAAIGAYNYGDLDRDDIANLVTIIDVQQRLLDRCHAEMARLTGTGRPLGTVVERPQDRDEDADDIRAWASSADDLAREKRPVPCPAPDADPPMIPDWVAAQMDHWSKRAAEWRVEGRTWSWIAARVGMTRADAYRVFGPRASDTDQGRD